jgi:outer membrane murein-binding lipoprotein Lpp
MLGEKKVIELEAFQKKLEETAKKVEEQIAKAAKETANHTHEEPKIEKL